MLHNLFLKYRALCYRGYSKKAILEELRSDAFDVAKIILPKTIIVIIELLCLSIFLFSVVFIGSLF